MQRLPIILMVISLLLTSCIKLGSKAETNKAGEPAVTQSQHVVSGLAQNPGELPSIQNGGESGSLAGINPPAAPVIGQPGSAPLSQSGSTSRQPASSSSNMGELQGGDQMSALPLSTGSGQMAEFPTSGQSGIQSQGMGALTNMESLKKAPPVFESRYGSGFSTDYIQGSLGQAFILQWQVYGADKLEITVSGGTVKSDIGSGQYLPVPEGRVAAVVVPESVGYYKFTITATNAFGSSSKNWELPVYSPEQVDKYIGGDRNYVFMVHPQQIKQGEPVFVYWNVRDADHVYLETDLAVGDKGEPDERDRVRSYGVEKFYPPASTRFMLEFGNGEYLDETGQVNPDYHMRTCEVLVE